MKQIITHPGAAHRDEFIAIGLVMANFNLHGQSSVPVYRREPTEAELNDPNTWVIDVGMRHEPDLHNFDHHQFKRDAEPACAMSLVAKFLGLDELLSRRPWYDVTRILDSKGPFALAAHLEIPRFPKELWSPIETVMTMGLEEFSGDQPVDPFLVKALWYLGRGLVHEAQTFEKDLLALRACSDRMDIVVNDIRVPALVSQGIPNPEAQASLKGEIDQAAGITTGLAICHDDRGPGWTLYRYNDHANVDLSRLEGDPRVSFAHVGGFIAKTAERLPLEEVLSLAKLSIR